MRALASSLGSWRLLERQEGTRVPHGLTFPLAVVEAIGRSHGLVMVAEEETDERALDFDAVFVSVMDARCLFDAGKHFAEWGIPPRRADRGDRCPLVFVGGQMLRNPQPFYDVADVIVVGDAEDPLPALLDLWHSHDRTSFLRRAADVPGVLVPVHHSVDHPVVLSVARDIGVTLREDITVSLDGTRRMEIARGCRYKCGFCSLGWRAPLRENAAAQVVEAVRLSPRRVHLQAGDAESHTGIRVIRRALDEHQAYDQGWTGRLDTLLANPDATNHASKRYAFGVEGVSHRLRRAVGKGYLTDERLVRDTCAHLAAIDGDSKGRAAWHVIAGLPTQRPDEWRHLARVISDIQRSYRGKHARNLSLHWQPFCPLPGTPMQWYAAGASARVMASRMKAVEGHGRVRIRSVVGRTDEAARLATVLARSDRRAVRVLERTEATTARAAAYMTGATWLELDPSEPAPWDHVLSWMSVDDLRAAKLAIDERLNAINHKKKSRSC